MAEGSIIWSKSVARVRESVNDRGKQWWQQQLEMVSAIDRLGIRPVIDKQFELSELASAFRYQESGSHFGKILITR
jgi:NADPH:quinone reductase-like Zn-dependent oxidoreductase